MITNTAAYQFVAIQDPQQLADSVLRHAEQQALKGSVLVAEEGINLFLAGEAEQVGAFYAWLQSDSRFAQMRIKYSLSAQQRSRGSRSSTSRRSSVSVATMPRRCKDVRLQ